MDGFFAVRARLHRAAIVLRIDDDQLALSAPQGDVPGVSMPRAFTSRTVCRHYMRS